MMKKFLIAAMVFAALLTGSTGIVSAEYSCEAGKEPGCFGDANYAFIDRSLPDHIGPYATNGGYPSWLADAPQYYYQDKCGMENRTSESYAIFRYMNGPTATGFYFCPFLDIPATEWVAYIQQQDPDRGYVLSETPVVGAIAIENGGVHGHASYVEEILSDNRVRVSEYDKLPGSYSESIISTQGVLFLIHSPMGGKGA